MEDLSRLVSASLAQNGVKTALNYQRLEWSRWFRCESSFSVLLAPSKPGIFALGEEMIPGPLELAPDMGGVEGPALSPSNGSSPVGKRMLALFEIAETGDLGIALGRLFLPGSRLRQKLESGNCFARYTVIEDPSERASAYAALRRWMEQSAETASGIGSRGAGALARDSSCGADIPVRDEPSLSFAGENLEQDRKMQHPAPLPLGF